MKSWLDEIALALLMAAAILLGTATNRDTEAEQATADTVADRTDESRDLELAVYLAEATERTQHPTATQSVRRRHPSAQTENESDQ